MRTRTMIACFVASMFHLMAFSEGSEVKKQEFNELTEEEDRVLIHKGTEAPFSGKYNDFFQDGHYDCKRCGTRLYNSDAKFRSSCGWPSFDDEVQGAIKRQKDADGRRIEILCGNCGAHLGHVFEGEGLTEKNVRHCVNSVSLVFVPNKAEQKTAGPATAAPITAQAYFAGGCFWGVEHLFEGKDGVVSASSGYMGGSLENPTYREVSRGNTGHLELVEVIYDPAKVKYEELARFFFEIHDPAQADGQGPDIGEQYHSVVFYRNEEERKTAAQLIMILKSKGYAVATKLLPASTFWKAEEYHQDYYKKNKKQPYCHAYKKKF